jgi:hypothetical protein
MAMFESGSENEIQAKLGVLFVCVVKPKSKDRTPNSQTFKTHDTILFVSAQ